MKIIRKNEWVPEMTQEKGVIWNEWTRGFSIIFKKTENKWILWNHRQNIKMGEFFSVEDAKNSVMEI